MPAVHREDQVRVRRQVSVRARRTGPAPGVPAPQVQDGTVPVVQLGRLLSVRSAVPFRAQGRRLHTAGRARLAAAVHVLVVGHRQRQRPRRLAGRPRSGHARRHVHAAAVARGLPVTGVQQAVRLAAGHRGRVLVPHRPAAAPPQRTRHRFRFLRLLNAARPPAPPHPRRRPRFLF